MTFNDGLVSIAKWAFNACPALSEVSIPKTVTEIGEYAFHGCLRWYADNEGEKEYDHYNAYDTPFVMKGYTNSVAQEYAMEPKYKNTFVDTFVEYVTVLYIDEESTNSTWIITT